MPKLPDQFTTGVEQTHNRANVGRDETTEQVGIIFIIFMHMMQNSPGHGCSKLTMSLTFAKISNANI